MAGTTTKGLRYPTAGDNPAVHTDIKNLADDVDAELDNYVQATGPTISGLALSDSSIVFEGATDDGFETTLTVADPTADRTVTIPDLTGTVMLRDASETISNKTLGTNLAAGGYKVTGLGSPTADTDAATYRGAYDNSRVVGMLLGGM